ncbi:myb/SANT-like DNA-binding domain-containing protein 3 [Anoplophora glabripennis]|uniref:myb/SANT-like DNA-binding domain-containing protein 3 n=1 Tax=Anoplophora glabripennis TaxID=217634 RepID=UPI000873C1A5|nr:myb/SANT-like DNA-binding domain-containing protein 3 [Anoplophora glabripennis]
MAAKIKRIIYSDADCHRLVDIINSYRNIVECKKTDATTWKQKNATWEKIAVIYNSATTEPRTSDQLRCKYDNSKKDVRKYEAQKRQSLYKTGGGANEIDIKSALKIVYDKIKTIISYSVNGLEPSQGDSDILEVEDMDKCSTISKNIHVTSDNNLQPIILCDNEFPEIILAGPSQPQEVLEDLKDKDNKGEYLQDWSDYTPKMLRSKKHKALQVKHKKMDTEVSELNSQDEDNFKMKMFNIKKELLEKEAVLEELNKEAENMAAKAYRKCSSGILQKPMNQPIFSCQSKETEKVQTSVSTSVSTQNNSTPNGKPFNRRRPIGGIRALSSSGIP